MTWIWSYLSLSSVSRDSLYRYLILRRLKLVEKEQTADKEGWLKLHQCVKMSLLFDFKGTVSPSLCLASDKHLGAHSLTPNYHMTLQLQWRSQRVSLGTTAQPHCQTWPSSASLGLANPWQSHSASVMILLKPPALAQHWQPAVGQG